MSSRRPIETSTFRGIGPWALVRRVGLAKPR